MPPVIRGRLEETRRRWPTTGWLGADDPLPARPRRVLVNGASGAGKTTLAAGLGHRLGLPHTEIDALHWGPRWTSRPTFADDVAALAASECWVTEYQYSQVRGMLTDRADLVVWLDLPRWLVLARVVRRTIVRRLTRAHLWGTNVEPSFRTFLTDRDHIVRWSWRTYPRAAGRVAELAASHPHLPVVRLRSRREVGRWLDGLDAFGEDRS